MDKSYAIKKYKYLHKNKSTKKQKYPDHRNHSSLHKPVRNFVSSYINNNKNNREKLENFSFPFKSSNTYTWWDCKPYKPKVYL